MAQTPREIIARTLTFKHPERIGRQMWLLPWAQKRYPEQLKNLQTLYPEDIIRSADVYQPSNRVQGDPFQIGTYVDEWGCVFENIQEGIIGEVHDPILKNIADRRQCRPPYEILPTNQQAAIDTVNRFCDQTDRFVMASCCPRPWERYQFLRGTVNAMMDLMDMEFGGGDLLKTIHEFYVKELEFWCKTNVDALVFMDDWGSQQSLLIAPDMWRQIFKPLYKDYCDLAKSHGKFIFMHSDGNILQIYSDLIEIGVSALNSQLFIMDMKQLARIARGKITFWGEIDRQHILCTPDTQAVRQAVQTVACHLYNPAGGIIAQFEFGPGTLPENAEAVFQEWDLVSKRERKLSR